MLKIITIGIITCLLFDKALRTWSQNHNLIEKFGFIIGLSLTATLYVFYVTYSAGWISLLISILTGLLTILLSLLVTDKEFLENGKTS